jgi:hypothetical protein
MVSDSYNLPRIPKTVKISARFSYKLLYVRFQVVRKVQRV